MTIMVVAHRSRLRKLMELILEWYPGGDDIVVPMDDGMSAVQYAYHNPVDRVYACMEVPPLNGLRLGKMVQEKQPGAEIYLIARTDEYVNDAVKSGCAGYYLDPVSPESLEHGNLLQANVH